MSTASVPVPDLLLREALAAHASLVALDPSAPAARACFVDALSRFHRAAEALGVAAVGAVVAARAGDPSSSLEAATSGPRVLPLEASASGPAPAREGCRDELVRPGEAPDPATSAPASAEALQQLAAGMGPAWAQRAAAPATIQPVGPLPHARLPMQPPTTMADALGLLEAVVEGLDPQDPHSDAELCASGAAVAAYARAAQERLTGTSAESERLKRVFQRLSRWSKQRRPGVIHGLSRQHTSAPYGDWWRRYRKLVLGGLRGPASGMAKLQSVVDRRRPAPEVVAAARDALEAGVPVEDPRWSGAIKGYLAALEREPALQALCEQVRRARAAQEGLASAESAAMPAADAGGTLGGKRLVAIGNMERPTLKAAMERQLGAQVEWYTNEPRRVASVTERIAAGRYDVVVMYVRFLDHTTTDAIKAAAKQAGVPLAVPTGGGKRATLEAVAAAVGPAA